MNKFFYCLTALHFCLLARAAPCPDTNEKPALSVSVSAKTTLIVCGYAENENDSRAKPRYSEFTIYSTQTLKPPKKLMSVGALENYWITPLSRKGLKLEEVWWVGKGFTPAFSSTIECENEKCTRSMVTCAFSVTAPPSNQSTADIEKRLGQKDSKTDAETLVAQLFTAALSGDLQAQALLLKTAQPKILDGAAAEDWHRSRGQLIRAMQGHCIK